MRLLSYLHMFDLIRFYLLTVHSFYFLYIYIYIYIFQNIYLGIDTCVKEIKILPGLVGPAQRARSDVGNTNGSHNGRILLAGSVRPDPIPSDHRNCGKKESCCKTSVQDMG
jgi:hypothetical protein